ncbi:MAG: hypothetical protein WC860_05775 [Candidatus Margulisiibacteriota bacterium]|jgi:hypothetical protein
MKKEWVRPSLIILKKGDQQETVLAGCKTYLVSGTPGTVNSECWGYSGLCNSCNSTLSS